MKAVVVVHLMLIVAGCAEQNESDEINVDASSVNGDDSNAPEQVDEEELKIATVLEVYSEEAILVIPAEWEEYDDPELFVRLDSGFESIVYDENHNEIAFTDIEVGDKRCEINWRLRGIDPSRC